MLAIHDDDDEVLSEGHFKLSSFDEERLGKEFAVASRKVKFLGTV